MTVPQTRDNDFPDAASRRYRRVNQWLTIALVTLVMTAGGAVAQDDSVETTNNVSEELINTQAERVRNQPDLTPEAREQLLADLESARTYLAIAEKQADAVAAFDAAVANEKDSIEQFTDRLKELDSDPPEVTVDKTRPETIESQIALVRTERKGLAERRTEILREIEDAPKRGAAIQERMAVVRRQIDDAQLTSNTPGARVESSVAYLVNRAAVRAWEAELRRLKAELISEPARRQVRSAERAWINKAIDDADRRLNILARASETAVVASTAAELAETDAIARKLQDTNPQVVAFADTNRELAKQLKSAARATDQARHDAARLVSIAEHLEEDSYLMSKRLEVIGHGALIGEVMMSQLENLPDTNLLTRAVKERNEQITEVSHQLIDVEEGIRELDQRSAMVKSLAPDYASLDDDARGLINQLLDQRSILLQHNERTLGGLVWLLVNNNEASNRIVTKTQEFHEFLMGNLLWVQNFGFLRVDKMKEHAVAILQPDNLRALPQQLLNGLSRSVLLTLLALLFLPLYLLSRQFRRRHRELLTTPTTLSGERLRNIFLGLFYDVVIALPWPLLIYLLGSALAIGEPRNEFVDALAPALQKMAQGLFVLLFLRRLIRPVGVGRRFLKWNARMLDALRQELGWAGPVIILCIFTEVFLRRLDVNANGGSLGAIATLLQAATVIAVCVRLMKQDIFREDAPKNFALLITAIATALCILPLLLGLLFASEIYQDALGASLVAVGLIKLASDILTRWLLIVRLRIERKNREERKALAGDGAEPESELVHDVDVASLSEAHAKLIGLVRTIATVVVLWLIWSPSLPMLTLLEDVTLWQTSDTSAGVDGLRATTLFDVIVALIILVITTLLARHLPSLVRLFLMEWAHISPGALYATSMLLQYLVVAIGASIFLTTIGWDWSRVQWLVAALGVGIGFGLQEIVANFISGIIILFERPIRVGDIITAGGAEGIVTEIRPRATVIQTFERKEYLIPNKELITGPVVNWSLSDDAIRLTIPVGIAYGSDVRQAMAIMEEVANEQPLVLPEPEPLVTFEDFGDNALLLWLRCYAAEDRLRVATALRTGIYDRLAAANIEISFPQRDVHLDFSDSLRVEIAGGNGNEDGGVTLAPPRPTEAT